MFYICTWKQTSTIQPPMQTHTNTKYNCSTFCRRQTTDRPWPRPPAINTLKRNYVWPYSPVCRPVITPLRTQSIISKQFTRIYLWTLLQKHTNTPILTNTTGGQKCRIAPKTPDASSSVSSARQLVSLVSLVRLVFVWVLLVVVRAWFVSKYSTRHCRGLNPITFSPFWESGDSFVATCRLHNVCAWHKMTISAYDTPKT